MLTNTKDTQMKNNKLILAALPSAIAAAAFLLFFRSPIAVENLIGYGSVVALLGLMAAEYRIDWKRVFGRE